MEIEAEKFRIYFEIKSLMSYEKLKYEFEEETSANFWIIEPAKLKCWSPTNQPSFIEVTSVFSMFLPVLCCA